MATVFIVVFIDSSSSVCHGRLSTDDPPTTQLRPHNRRIGQLVNLRWLRIPERIQFKLALLVYKVLHGLAPQYLGPLTRVFNLPGRRALRSAGTNQLDIPFVRLSTVGGRAFVVAGP